jgi:hypothetical protein
MKTAATISIFVGFCASAYGQSLTPTTVRGVHLVTMPPDGYAIHALPPEPLSARPHEAWRRAVTAAHEVAPQVKELPMTHGPAIRKTRISNDASSFSALNWSGTSIVNGQTSNIEAVTAMFVVPIARQAFGTCSPEWDWVSLWAGIDGSNGSTNPIGHNDVLQAGVSAAATCTDAAYSAWLEWYPNPAIGLSSPAINPGDLVFVEIWSTSPIQGWVVIYNYSTDISAEYGISAPTGISLQGSSVEWIVERPGLIPDGITTLTNYVATAWSAGEAWNYSATNPTVYPMGSIPSQGTLEQITMTDNNGQPISSAVIEGPAFLWFQNYGSSCGANTQPC